MALHMCTPALFDQDDNINMQYDSSDEMDMFDEYTFDGFVLIEKVTHIFELCNWKVWNSVLILCIFPSSFYCKDDFDRKTFIKYKNKFNNRIIDLQK